MSKKARQILAIIALFFMAVFSVSFVAFLINKNAWGGSAGIICVCTIAVALSILGVIKLTDAREKNAKKLQEAYLPAADESDADVTGADVTDESDADVTGADVTDGKTLSADKTAAETSDRGTDNNDKKER